MRCDDGVTHDYVYSDYSFYAARDAGRRSQAGTQAGTQGRYTHRQGVHGETGV